MFSFLNTNNIMEKLINSLEYSALDHKWVARNYLKEAGWTVKKIFGKLKRKETSLKDTESIMLNIALSAFRYYYIHYDNITKDASLGSVTTLCTSSLNSVDVDSTDRDVFYLSHRFNKLVNSDRKLLKCYDCGTNARAVFLKLIETGRGNNEITSAEQERMSREYVVHKVNPVKHLQKCLSKLKKDDGKNVVCIMSVSIDGFGHVWVLEKKYINSKPRIHHYQSALGSHMLIDFIESMDYGANPMKSLNLEFFGNKLTNLLSVTEQWKEEHYRIFAELFAFMPVSPVNKPEPGFSWTWIEP
jgi:hypothetical protein